MAKLKLAVASNEQTPLKDDSGDVNAMKDELRFWFLHYRNTRSEGLNKIIAKWKKTFSSSFVDRYVEWIGQSVYRESLGKSPYFSSTVVERG